MMTSWEIEWKRSFNKAKTSALRPLLALLARTGVTPNMLSITGLLIMVGFPVFVVNYTYLAISCLIAQVVIDGFLDGGLARYLGTESEKGQRLDMACDTVCYVLFLIGIARMGLLPTAILLIFAVIIVILRISAFALNKVKYGTPIVGFFPWIIHALSYVSFLFFEFAGPFIGTDKLYSVFSSVFSVLFIIAAAVALRNLGELS